MKIQQIASYNFEYKEINQSHCIDTVQHTDFYVKHVCLFYS